MILRSISFFIVALVALSAPLWVGGIVAAVYALRWFALEIVVLAFAIDLVFGTHHWPFYTVLAVLLVAFVEWWKPTLSVY